MPIHHVAPELAVVGGAVATILLPLLLGRGRQWIAAVVALLALAIAAAATIDLHARVPVQLTFSGAWALDDLTLWGRVIVIGATAVVVAVSPKWFRTDARHGEWYAMLLLSCLGALVLVGAADTVELLVGLLLASVTGYALASWHRADRRCVEAGAKYFFLGALTNPLLLLGITLLYGLHASTRYAAMISDAVPGAVDPWAATLAVAFVLCGLALELGAVPAHPWVPDVAQAGPAPAAAFLTVVPKIAALFALARIVRVLPADVPWRAFVAAIALATMTVGNLAALRQSDVRRMLGWSAVSQAGYGLLAIVALGRSELALPSLQAFAVAYALAELGAFGCVVALRGRTEREGYAGLAFTRPALAAALTLSLLSLAGIPPLVGFTAKLALFGAAIDAGYGWLALAAVANTVVSLFYYLAVIARMVFPPSGDRVAVLGRVPVALSIALGAGTVVAGVGVGAWLVPIEDARVRPAAPAEILAARERPSDTLAHAVGRAKSSRRDQPATKPPSATYVEPLQ